MSTSGEPMYELVWRVLRTKLPVALKVRQSKELETLLTRSH